MNKELNVVSLFSGCGGMDLGFRGDFEIFGQKFSKNPFNIVYANDIEKKACETYEYNLKHKPYCGDVREIDLTTLPKADIVIGRISLSRF